MQMLFHMLALMLQRWITGKHTCDHETGRQTNWLIRVLIRVWAMNDPITQVEATEAAESAQCT